MRQFILILLFTCVCNTSIGCLCFNDSLRTTNITKFKNGNSNIIFKGTFIKSEFDSSFVYDKKSYLLFDNFIIHESWLGLDTSLQNIKILNSQSSCDFNFYKDSTYIIYASLFKQNECTWPIYETSICYPTINFENAHHDIEILGKSIKHINKLAYYKSGNAYDFKSSELLLALIVIVLFVLYLREKNKKSSA